jgi:hypothetical protein
MGGKCWRLTKDELHLLGVRESILQIHSPEASWGGCGTKHVDKQEELVEWRLEVLQVLKILPG